MNNFDPAFHIHQPIDRSLATAIRLKIRAWVTSPWLADLVGTFGGSIASEGGLNELLEQLEVFSDRWDFRRIARENRGPNDDKLKHELGTARWLTTGIGLPHHLEARILDAAKHLGLVDAQAPAQRSYNYIVVLGGARLSCQLRPLLAREVMHAGVRTDSIVLLGAARPVADSERDATDTYAPGAIDEFDLLVAGAQGVFRFEGSAFDEERNDDPNAPNLSWVVKRFKGMFEDRQLNIIAISAPSSDPLRRRANSADTIRFFLDKEGVRAGSELLLITSQIYVPYVQLEALRTVALPQQVLVETVGFPGERMPTLQGLSNPNHYLQEIRSAVQAARRFCQTYPE